jgi:hypothetical protein
MKWAALPAALALAAATACVSTPGFLRSAPARTWPATLSFAQQSANAGHYASADSSLTVFAARYPTAPQTAESDYWRALFAIDPRNAAQSPADAIAAINSYFAAPKPRSHDTEAAILARTATDLMVLRSATVEAASVADSARTLADSVLTIADSAQMAHALRDRYSNAEVRRLRDSLDKVLVALAQTNQELDRIKKRLAAPKP